jgi:hypothetical protein
MSTVAGTTVSEVGLLTMFDELYIAGISEVSSLIMAAET